MWRRGVVVLALVALLAGSAHAAATIDSVLNCPDTEVRPNQNITCFIYAQDETQAPTTQFLPTDFAVRVSSTVSSAVITISPVKLLGDPTAAFFTITSDTGTALRIEVVVAPSYLPVYNSGVAATVLAPVTRLEGLQCSRQTIVLRTTVQCTANAYGANGIPALVAATDLYFSEDHNTGSFAFNRGNVLLIFSFSAPASLPMNFSKFKIRVSIAGSGAMYSVELPLLYPSLPATDRSLLRCVDTLPITCFVTAADAVGPVLFNPADFDLSFLRVGLNTDGVTVYSPFAGMNVEWRLSSVGPSSRQLSFSLIDPNEVFSLRLSLSAARSVVSQGADGGTTAAAGGSASGVATNAAGAAAGPMRGPVIGSPYDFTSGHPASAGDAWFRRCDKSYLQALETVMCYIDVATNVIADPSYFVVSTQGGGTVSSPTYRRNPVTNGSQIVFQYTASDTSSRLDDSIRVTIADANIDRSPYRMVVFPVASEGGEPTKKDPRARMVAVGFSTFGLVYFAGLVYAGKQAYNKKKRREALSGEGHGHSHSHDGHGHSHGHDAPPPPVSPSRQPEAPKPAEEADNDKQDGSGSESESDVPSCVSTPKEPVPGA